jgi:hypothetical protein
MQFDKEWLFQGYLFLPLEPNLNTIVGETFAGIDKRIIG